MRACCSLLLEVAQVRRLLVFSRRHQIPVPAHEIVFLADDDMVVVLIAIVLEPPDLAVATIALVHRPWMREGIVNDRDYVVHDVVVGFVERNSLLDDGLIILMKRYAVESDRA